MARKTRTLPFVVQPRLAPVIETIGNEYSGTIQIERRGYLSVAEKAWTQAFDQSDDSQARLFSVAAKIGSKLSMDPREVFELIQTTGGQDSRLAEFSGELMDAIQSVNSSQERKGFVMATCLIQSRIDPKWEVEDTMGLHPDIVKDLSTLFEEEEAKSIDALLAAEANKKEDSPSDAPALGKD